jgi:Sel1 repeat-containing protein
LASSTERSEDERALPRPELNPLVNPLLADNMGRWAEVYFTSPPEKREEAVVELLRELEARSSDVESHPASAQAVHAASTKLPSTAFERPTTERQARDSGRCYTCGHHNPPMHQFCGMCGAPLDGTALEHPKMERPYELQSTGNNSAEAPAYGTSSTDYREPIEEGLPPAEEPRRDLYDLSPFQSLLEREDGSESGYDESPSGRYRYFIGAILAILILVLGYAAWKSSRSDQNAQGAPPPPPPAATDTAPAATSPNPPASATSKPAEQQPAPANSTARPSPPKPVEPPKQLETVASGRNAPSATPASRSTIDNIDHVNFQGNGAEELATAQRFLHGSPGQARDTAEAAKWLWKSIAKHNGPAMLDLADLYLKGDGVSKNCDQARVLLDSAARRGMAGAGARLRNLQAFGCQ